MAKLTIPITCYQIVYYITSGDTLYFKYLSSSHQVTTTTLAGVAQLVGVLSYKPKDHGFNCQSGHMSKWQVWSPVGVVGVHRRSDRCFSASLSLPAFPSL